MKLLKFEIELRSAQWVRDRVPGFARLQFCDRLAIVVFKKHDAFDAVIFPQDHRKKFNMGMENIDAENENPRLSFGT